MFRSVLSILFLASLLCNSTVAQTTRKALTIYVYDSLASEEGLGSYLKEKFKANSGISANIRPSGNAEELLSRVLLEKSHPKADIILGFSGLDVGRIRLQHPNLFLPYKSIYSKQLDSNLIYDSDFQFIPFDYSPFAFIYNPQKLKDPPLSMRALFSDRMLANKIIIQNPKTSGPGFGLLTWSAFCLGPELQDLWRSFFPNILAIPNSWSAAYGMFLKGEAAVVFSYLTSLAYHMEKEGSTRYKAMLFSEGHLVQVEFAAILKSSDQAAEAKEFIDFLLSKETQEAIPVRNWMFPANRTAKLPKSFSQLSRPEKLIFAKDPIEDPTKKEWLKTWIAAHRHAR